ncbi:MAG: hypothetical protein E6J82_03140 [Deltaproteobacteria bacterium]|nr:MAG: hypothetical protein E6J82_03140 [Deltaproteobacteria bacterium]
MRKRVGSSRAHCSEHDQEQPRSERFDEALPRERVRERRLKSVSRPRSPGIFADNSNPANPARSSATENIRRNSGRESNSAATAAPRCRMEAVAKTANASATSIAHAAGAPGMRATANAMAIIGG